MPASQLGSQSRRWRRSPRAAASILVSLLVALLPIAAHTAAPAARADSTGATYTNPVIAQTTPDPAIIKALDGYYYVIATSDYWQDGSFHLLPIYRSTDLVHWSFVGDAFPSRPAWVDPNAGLWAPDLQYYNHKYFMYYVASNANALPAYNTTGGSAIGVATADSPAGPWTDAGAPAGGSYASGPIVPPRPCVGNTYCGGAYFATIDPAEFTDHDGQKYMYYGSFFGGTLVQKLAPDGLHTQGTAIQIGHWDRYEGTYVIRHDVGGKAYFYNFSSTANCCQGPNTAYSVVVSRATSPMGPFVDQNGFPMMNPTGPVWTGDASQDPAGMNIGAQGGGYPTLKQNGNRWNGPGHNAIVTDLSGRDWIVYHAVDKANGWVDGAPASVGQITYRQMLIDPIDWTPDGWPVVNGGAGPSDGPNAAPDTTPVVGDNFNPSSGCAAPGNGDDLSANWSVVAGSWDVNAGSCTTGGYAEQTATSGVGLLVSRGTAPASYRAECDLRLETAGANGRYGCVASYRQGRSGHGGRFLAAYLDPGRNVLATVVYNNGHPIGREQDTPLPSGFDFSDWHHLSIDANNTRPGLSLVRVTVSDSNRDPLAVQQRALPAVFGLAGGSVGFATIDAHADFDNVTAAPLDTTVAPSQLAPAAGALLPAFSDEFNGSLGPQWSWVREDPTRHGFTNGQLSISLNGDLYRDANNATNLLVENEPSGDYMVETKITVSPTQNFQQAGLLIYSDDDHYIKIGPAHLFSLNKLISGHESLEPVPAKQGSCDVGPAAHGNVAVVTYTAQLCPNEGEGWDYLSNPNPTPNDGPNATAATTDWLRVYRQGDVYTPYVSLDGAHWVRGTAWSMDAASAGFPVKIGLFAFWGGQHDVASEPVAHFDYVHVFTYNP